MSSIYIHKASNKYVILSLAVLLSLVFAQFSFLFNVIPQSAESKEVYAYYFELGHDADVNKEKYIQNFIEQVFDNNLIKYEYKDRKQAWSEMRQKLKLEFTNNPLFSILTVHSELYLQKSMESKLSGVDHVKNWKSVQMSKAHPGLAVKAFSNVLLPLAILCFILYLSIVNGAIQSNLSSNKKTLESLVLSGAHHSKMVAVFRRNALLNFTLAFLLGVFLYFICIYLILYRIDFSIEQLSISNVFKSIIIPCLILLSVHMLIILWKVDKYLKSI